MNLYVSMHSNQPIYEQLKDQIRQAILHQTLTPHAQLPSIRTLSKELSIGILTVKRAYDDLVNEGFLVAQMGKGYYVNQVHLEDFRKIYTEKIRQLMNDVRQLANDIQLSDQELVDLLKETKEKS